VKLFTREEAEALLPQVRAELEAMRTCKEALDALRGEMGRASRKATGNGHVEDRRLFGEGRREAEQLAEEINERLARLSAWGVEVKGIDEGLVDFPHERDGHVVYLCWRLGEDHIGWWHELDTGFAGRQPL
jgi:hypothetical protein